MYSIVISTSSSSETFWTDNMCSWLNIFYLKDIEFHFNNWQKVQLNTDLLNQGYCIFTENDGIVKIEWNGELLKIGHF
jgi:hypothetical protein